MGYLDEEGRDHGSIQPDSCASSSFEALSCRAKSMEVKKRRPIYVAGDPSEAIYVIRTGRVKISSCDQSGKEVTFSILKPGDIIGELEVLEGHPRENSAEALDDVCLSVISRDDFLRHIREHPEMALALTRLVGARLRQLQNRVEDLVFRDVPARLAHLLQELGEAGGVPDGPGRPLCTKLTHQEMASLIGCNRETVSAILGQFREQGLVRLNRRSITILNMDRVASLVM